MKLVCLGVDIFFNLKFLRTVSFGTRQQSYINCYGECRCGSVDWKCGVVYSHHFLYFDFY